MPRDVRVHLDYVSGLSLEQFRSDQKTLNAVIRNLEVIGEAAKKV